MAYRQVVGAHLREDKRINYKWVAERRVYCDDHYEVFVLVYPGIPGEEDPFHQNLAVCMVMYKDEQLKIFLKAISATYPGPIEDMIKKVVHKWEAEGKTPFDFVRDAKKWCNVDFTEADLAAFEHAGISQP